MEVESVIVRRCFLALVLVAAAATPARPAGAATAVQFRCSGENGIAAMENSYILGPGAGPCWMHLGHHTYDLGGLHRVGNVAGSVFSVEIQFSPPTETREPGIAPVVFEGSPDAATWTTLYGIPYRLVGSMRQGITFAFDAGGFLARYLRIRQPHSAAQGLSGYLDNSEFVAGLEPVATVEPPVGAGVRELRCGRDNLDPALPGHPCWFGGINRYDAASFFHTYPLGGVARLDAVEGSVTFLPWRTDDYSGGASRTSIAGFVQRSADGVNWSSIGRVEGFYGAPIPFSFAALAGAEARYVRLAAEKHAQYTSHPALKHLRGMILDSALRVQTANAGG